MPIQDVVSALMDGRKRREWLDRQDERLTGAVQHYLGPGFSDAAMGATRILGMLSPGQDMMDMQQAGTDLMQSRGPADAMQNAGWLGAATLGMALPGNAGAIREATEEIAEQAPKRGILAYHGSPHDFDRFDMDKIGTGEGAQAYGHGLYFAENERVAKDYKAALAGLVDGKKLTQSGLSTTAQAFVDDAVMNGRPATLGDVIKHIEGAMKDKPFSVQRQMRSIIDDELAPRASQSVKPGHMYEVNIAANPDDFLDWDKPLSEQSEKVREEFAQFGINDPALRGADALEQYQAAISRLGSSVPAERASSEWLSASGVPGIRYLDQGSRTAGDGSRNYVVFDDKTVEILRKYGLLLPGIGLGGMVAQGEE